ncbi:hypothetical protein O0I10_003679 [Lichtheimia ornata]|uniref:Denticleless protein homolog n=1 Tax=Lichtheimia ornata TaxID=688661 RepID=A0AAD7V8Z6_9FUNG|nr:uncharacterized protein O0I10_003679 [Lichtheimia ornata]KAJ8660631.1 hypothetical protein O0I10_003679 [Lichtheimia ornata]
MFKRKRDSDTQLNDDNNNNAISSSGNNNQDNQDHQQLACNDTAQTSVIDVENPKLFRQCTDPLEWNLIKYRDMRSTHARRAFGRVLYPPQRMLLERLSCALEDRYHFCFPNQKKCVPFVCAYNNSACDGQILAVGDEAKRITLLRTDVGNSIDYQDYHVSFGAHTNAVLTLKWSNDDTSLLSGSADGRVRLWDTESRACAATFMGHSSSLRSIDWHPTNPNLLVSSSMDGSFMMWDLRHKQIKVHKDKLDVPGLDAPVYGPIKITKHAHEMSNYKGSTMKENIHKKPPHSVTSAMFMPNYEDRIITSGSHDGTIKIWDCRAGRDAKSIVHYNYDGDSNRPRGIADMRLDHSGTRLFSLCMDGSVNLHYLTNITRPAVRFTDPDYTISSFFVKISISHDDRFLIAGSSSNTVFAWEIDRPEAPTVKYTGHKREVGSVSWCQQRYQFASCSDDGCVRVWDFDVENDPADGYEPSDEE